MSHSNHRHTGHAIAELSFTQGLVVCACGWRSVRGLGGEALAEAYRAHRRLVGERDVQISEVAESKRWRYG